MRSKPRVKPEHAPYRTTDHKVRIGGGVIGLAAEIDDPDGWVGELLNLADGSRSHDQIVQAMTTAHPQLGVGQVTEALAQLDAAGYLEESPTIPPAGISARDAERYANALAYYRWTGESPEATSWDPQLRLKATSAIILGIGGIGSAAAVALAAAGVGHLHLVDRDVIELSNLSRQIVYRESDIGRPKAEVAAAFLQQLNSDITVTYAVADVKGPGQLSPLISGFDLLVQCADRPSGIRTWCNQVCLELGIPWVDGGYAGPHVTVGAYTPGNGACWECLRNAENERLDLPLLYGADIEKTLPRAPGNPVSAPSAMLAGSLTAHAALSLITRAPRVPTGCVFGLNLLLPDRELIFEKSPRRVDCQACSTKGLAVTADQQ